MTIEQRRLEILDWEKNNRTSLNRSTKGEENVRCAYSGPIGCAVGRLIDDKELCAELDAEDDGAVYERHVFAQLPDHIKELGQDFLNDLQVLHDSSQAWNENGLSSLGKNLYEKIKAQRC